MVRGGKGEQVGHCPAHLCPPQPAHQPFGGGGGTLARRRTPPQAQIFFRYNIFKLKRFILLFFNQQFLINILFHDHIASTVK